MAKLQISVKSTTTGWSVEYQCGGLQIPGRQLDFSQHGQFAFPLPKETPATAYASLCGPANGGAINQHLSNLSGIAMEEEVVRFGHYLFAALIGEDTWQQIQAAGGPFDLVLSTRIRREGDADWEDRIDMFDNLPWEMMRRGNQFLLAQDVSLSRSIDRDGAPHNIEIDLPLRALFVVGSKTSDARIKAGAEFYGILRALRGKGAALIDRILLNADRDQLVEAIAEFDPHVVHFISHGHVQDGKGRLRLQPTSEDDDGLIGSEQLGAILGGTRIVVLNACGTGGTFDHQSANPLAVELIHQGIHVAVGMGGEVSDTACRLFARQFYRALVDCQCIHDAARLGRLGAFVGGNDPRESVEWAKPVIFASSNITISVVPGSATEAANRVKWANRIAGRRSDLCFCDRTGLLDSYRQLSRLNENNVTTSVLVFNTSDIGQKKDDRFGKSRALREIAKLATLEGKAPCLASDKFVRDRLAELGQQAELATVAPCVLIGLVVRDCIRKTRHVFTGATNPAVGADAMFTLAKKVIDHDDTPQGLPQQVVVAREFGGWDQPQCVGAAIREDLIQLQEDVGRPVVFLADNAHSFVDNELTFVKHFLNTAHGIGRTGHVIPVVMTSSTRGTPTEQEQGAKMLYDWLQEASNEVVVEKLTRFEGLEEETAYRHLMILNTPPHVFKNPERAGDYIQSMKKLIAGVPSRLDTKSDDIMEICDLNWTDEADDDEILAGLQN